MNRVYSYEPYCTCEHWPLSYRTIHHAGNAMVTQNIIGHWTVQSI